MVFEPGFMRTQVLIHYQAVGSNQINALVRNKFTPETEGNK